jgi:trimethylamine--corrinoid protein Co-methyltransferase
LRGIEVNEETLGFAAIEEAVYGEGHFLGSQHTMAAMQRDYFWPTTLSDRQQPSAWEEGGASDMWERANTRVRQILADHKPDYLGDDVDQRLRRDYKIKLESIN